MVRVDSKRQENNRGQKKQNQSAIRRLSAIFTAQMIIGTGLQKAITASFG